VKSCEKIQITPDLKNFSSLKMIIYSRKINRHLEITNNHYICVQKKLTIMIRDYLNAEQERILEELFSLIRIPSISAHPDKKETMYTCAGRWCELLLQAGADKAEILPTAGNPVVFAEKIIDDKLPTVMVYGHYDVMPAENPELWESPPFEPEIRNGKIYARGADDDKGQSFMHAKAFEYLTKNGLLNCNVKFLIEGEEEIGSVNLEAFCESNKKLLSCDYILVSDTSMLGENTPSITTGLRGLSYWQIEVTGPNRDLHSGIFGGTVANPLNELCNIIAGMKDDKGKITIPGFYNDVIEASDNEREKISMVPFNEMEYMKNIGVESLRGEEGYSPLERTGIRPALDLCGIWGGYMGEGSKTVLPSKAFAKLSARLVPNQNYEEIMSLVSDYIQQQARPGITIKVTPLHGAAGYVFPVESPAYYAAEKAYEKVFEKTPAPVRRGGSIGVVPVFEKVLGIKPLLMGFGLESDAIHSPNENFPLEMFKKGTETIIRFYMEMFKQQQ
jgi:acetylornithine deacetylase/succinyl-diaminopimelate desuccinylase-like protein